MKKSLLFIAGIVFSLSAHAQITLSSSNAPSLSLCQQGDSFRRLKLNSIPSIAPATNATWDMTTASDSVRTWQLRDVAMSSTAFPNAGFYNEAYYNFAVLGYNTTNIKNVTANGILMYGVHIDRQAISLAPFTGNTTDSVVFPLQDVVFNTPDVELKYPITMGDSWGASIKYITDLNLTVAAYSLNNTPGERHVELAVNKSVVGWGKMRVNDENGVATDYMDVLMVKMVRVVKDSFYLAGSPAPASLLSAFGLSQGQTQVRSVYSFYRANEYAPLLEAVYEDSTFSKIERCDIHEDRLKPTSVRTISREKVDVYPNPITGNSFTVKVTSANKGAKYELYNMTGQMLQSGVLSVNGKVELETAYPTGNYLIKLRTRYGALGVQQLNIIK